MINLQMYLLLNVMTVRAVKNIFLFQIEVHGIGMDYWKLYGDPICDSDGMFLGMKIHDLLT